MPIRSSLPFLGFLAAAWLCGCATTGDAERPTGPVVKQLEIDGTKKLDEDEIKKKILTAEKSWWRFWEDAPRYEPNAWLADLRRIERYYQANGFYDAKVISDAVKPLPGNTVALSVRVEEGESTTISRIDVTGLEGLSKSHQKTTLEDLPLKVGDVFLEENWSGVKEHMTLQLRELGYAEALVKGEVFVDVDKRQAAITLQAEPGIRYKFGNIFVATDPNPKVRAARIIEQAQGAVKQGDWYSESALSEAQSRVFQMNVFGAVKVNRGAPDPVSGTVPVVVDVREAPFHTVRAGGGVGIDQTHNEGRLLAEYTDRNFLGGLRRFTVRGRVGYAFLPSALAVIQKSANAQSPSPIFSTLVEFEQPRFLFRDVRAQGTLEVARGVEPAYRYFSGRTRLGAIWQPHPSFSVFPSYNLEAYFIDSGSAILDQGASPSLRSNCSRCFLSYLEQTVEWDRRNDRQDPRRGFYAAISVQEGGGPLGGSFNYIRILPDVRYYAPFFEERLIIATRLRAGTLITSDESSPVVARFFSGGPGMRGFNNRRLSPMQARVNIDPAPTLDSAGNLVFPEQFRASVDTVPVGGNALFEGTVEARYAVTESLVLAVFYDTGTVTTVGFNPGNIAQNLQHAIGVGFRYRTLIGPIRVDFARRLNIGPPLPVAPANLSGLPIRLSQEYPRYSGCFGIGETHDPSISGAPESPCAFHLSIGEAF